MTLEVKPPTDFHCKVCGAVLSSVTLTCVRGEYCKPKGEAQGHWFGGGSDDH